MATKKKKKKLTRRQMHQRRKHMLIAEVVILAILLVGLAAWVKVGSINYNNIGTVDTNELSTEAEEVLDEYTTIACFGVDNRSVGNYDSGNSDSIIIVSINNTTKEVRLMSVYRDSFLDCGDGDIRKCNYAYNHGGVEGALAMLNRNLDLNIQDYVAVDFYALTEAVDIMGGVDMDITAEEAQIMNDCYINETAEVTGKTANMVSAGQQTLDGVQATAYCRIRYTSGDDFKRTQRQRDVLTKLIDKCRTMSVSQASEIIDKIFPMISTSYKMSELVALAADVSDYTLGDSKGFPFDKVTGTFGSKGNLVVPCTLESNVVEMYAYLFDHENYEPSDTVKEISNEIVNYTGKTESDAADYGY